MRKYEEYSHHNQSKEVSLTPKEYLALQDTKERKYLWKEEARWVWEYPRKNTEPLNYEVLCESERKNTLAFVEIS